MRSSHYPRIVISAIAGAVLNDIPDDVARRVSFALERADDAKTGISLDLEDAEALLKAAEKTPVFGSERDLYDEAVEALAFILRR